MLVWFMSIKSPVITMMFGVFSEIVCNSFVFPAPNSALCKSDTCAILYPENPAGIRSLETLMVFTISAVFPHAVHIISASSTVSTQSRTNRLFVFSAFIAVLIPPKC